MKRVFVIGIMLREETFDSSLENALAQVLRDRGFVVATASSVFAPWQLDKEKLVQYVRDNEVDLVIQQRLATHATSAHTPPSTTVQTLGSNPLGGW